MKRRKERKKQRERGKKKERKRKNIYYHCQFTLLSFKNISVVSALSRILVIHANVLQYTVEIMFYKYLIQFMGSVLFYEFNNHCSHE